MEKKWIFLFLALGGINPDSAFAHDDLHEAIADVSEAIASSPQDAGLYFHRAELYRLHRDWAAAESDYAKAAKLDHSLHVINLGRAQIFLAKGDPDTAMELLNTFLLEDPHHPEGRMLRAGILEDRGEWKLADADLAIAVDASPEPHYASMRAALLQRYGQINEAVRCLDDASARNGRIPILEQQALEIEEQAGNTEAALTRLNHFIDREPRPDIWLVHKAHLLERACRTDEAQTAWRQAAAAFAKIPPEKRALEINRKLEEEITAAIHNLPKATQ